MELAGESSYSTPLLVTHIAIALVLIGLTAHALRVAWRPLHRRWSTRGVTLLTFLSVLGATIAGFLFLFGGQNNAALVSMEGLGFVAIIGAILMFVWGTIPIGLRKG